VTAEGRRPRRPRSDRPRRPPRQMVHIYLPQKIHQQLEDHERQTGKTHADVVLDAVEATYTTLLLPGAEPSVPPGALFARSSAEHGRRVDGELVLVGVRLLTGHLTQIDELVSASTATSRSAYIVAALRAHLERIARQENV
jgi:hypothetical protein